MGQTEEVVCFPECNGTGGGAMGQNAIGVAVCSTQGVILGIMKWKLGYFPHQREYLKQFGSNENKHIHVVKLKVWGMCTIKMVQYNSA